MLSNSVVKESLSFRLKSDWYLICSRARAYVGMQTIANMTTEWGALAGVFPVDDVLLQWLEQRSRKLQAR